MNRARRSYYALALALVLLGTTYAQVEGYPELLAPSSVAQVAAQRMPKKIHGQNGSVGTPIRFFINILCDSLETDSASLRRHINAAASTGASDWYVPIYVDGALHGIMEVVRYPGREGFRYAGYRLAASYLSLSIVEIYDYWVRQRGYHPIIIQCGYNTMLHIPELGPNNLTHFATTVLPRDQAPGVRKCRFHKWDIENGVSGSGDEAWEEYVRQSKGETKKEGLAKILAAPSDFTTVDSLETGIEWLKNNPSGK